MESSDTPDQRDRGTGNTGFAAVPSGFAGSTTSLRPSIPVEDLHICPACSSRLVYPIEWAPVDMCHWRVELRCPDCEWTQAGLYEQAVLDRFDHILDSGTDSLVEDLQKLQRSNMEDELSRFNLALSADLILPEDF